MSKQQIVFDFNGGAGEAWVFPHETALDVLRDQFGAGEVRYGCGEGVCGTCTVLVDGEPVSGCLLLAVQLDGRDVRTVRGLAEGDDLHPLQESFLRHGAAQCGYCTPGMIITAHALLARRPAPSRDEIRHELVGNLCRCTGYTKILDAIEEHASRRVEA
jgi:carbon-monoxide dehydrogenase small subunit